MNGCRRNILRNRKRPIVYVHFVGKYEVIFYLSFFFGLRCELKPERVSLVSDDRLKSKALACILTRVHVRIDICGLTTFTLNNRPWFDHDSLQCTKEMVHSVAYAPSRCTKCIVEWGKEKITKCISFLFPVQRRFEYARVSTYVQLEICECYILRKFETQQTFNICDSYVLEKLREQSLFSFANKRITFDIISTLLSIQ